MNKEKKDVLTMSLSLLVINGVITEEEFDNAKPNGYEGLLKLLNSKYDNIVLREKGKIGIKK